MKKEDIEIEKVYWLKYHHNIHNCWIIKFSDTTLNKVRGVYIGDINNQMSNCFSKDNIGNYTDIEEHREATPLEKAQLDACIKADKFIPLKDVTPTNVGIEYEIY